MLLKEIVNKGGKHYGQFLHLVIQKAVQNLPQRNVKYMLHASIYHDLHLNNCQHHVVCLRQQGCGPDCGD